MEFSIVENLSGLQESIFNLSRGPQLHFGEKSKNWSNFIKFIDFPPFPLFGVPWAAVIFLVIRFLYYAVCSAWGLVLGSFNNRFPDRPYGVGSIGELDSITSMRGMRQL